MTSTGWPVTVQRMRLASFLARLEMPSFFMAFCAHLPRRFTTPPPSLFIT